jgi:hypothetical protein
MSILVRNVSYQNFVFYRGELLALRPTTKLEDRPLSAVRDCLVNMFVATHHTWRPVFLMKCAIRRVQGN